MSDLISRQAAIDALDNIKIPCNASWYPYYQQALTAVSKLPSVQPERLTNDDFETIRIHLSAFKEKLGNQGRWKEAEEYQRLIDRFMVFAQSGIPRIIYCVDCKWLQCNMRPNGHLPKGVDEYECRHWCGGCDPMDFCSHAERRTDG